MEGNQSLKNLAVEDLNSVYSLTSTIKTTQCQIQTKRQRTDEIGEYRAFSYPFKQLTKPNKLKIQEEIQKYCLIDDSGLSQIVCYSIGENNEITIITKEEEKTLKDSLLMTRFPFKQLRRNQIMMKLAQSLSKIHQKGLFHGRINLDRIFYKEKDCIIEVPYFRAIEKIQRAQFIRESEHDKKNIYLAPQVFEGYCFSQKSDIWALGMILLQLSLEKCLEQTIRKQNLSQRIADLIERVKNDDVKYMLKLMLLEDPNQRITSKEVVQFLSDKQNRGTMPGNIYFSLSFGNLFFSDNLEKNDRILRKFLISSQIIRKANDVTIFQLIPSNEKDDMTFYLQKSLIKGSSKKIRCLIEESTLSQDIQRYILDLRALKSMIQSRRLNLKVADDGNIIGYFDCKEGQVRIKGDRVQPQKLKRVNRCMMTLKNRQAQSYQGLLISLGLVLTPAEAIAGVKNLMNDVTIYPKIEADEIPQRSFSTLSFGLNEEKCPNQQKIRYDLLQLCQSFPRKRYISLVYNYSEQETYSKLKVNGDENIEFHYQVGDYDCLRPDQILFMPNHKFRALRPVQFVMRGTPLFLVFSHNQCYSLGMFDNDEQGYIFDQQFYWNIQRWLLKDLLLKSAIPSTLMTRLLAWEAVDIFMPQPPYDNSYCLGIQNESQKDYFLSDMPDELSIQLQKAEQLCLQHSKMFVLGQSYHKILLYQQQLQLYQSIYGSNSDIVFCYYLKIAFSELSSGNIVHTQPLQKIANRVDVLQRNILVYTYANLLLGELNLRESKNEQAKNCLLKVKSIVERLNCPNWLYQLYSCLCTISCFQNNLDVAESQSQKAICASRQFKNQKSIEQLIRGVDINLQLHALSKASQQLREGYSLINQTIYMARRNQLKQKLREQWSKIGTALLTSHKSTPGLITLFIKLSEKYEPERSTKLVPILQERQSILENIISQQNNHRQ